PAPKAGAPPAPPAPTRPQPVVGRPDDEHGPQRLRVADAAQLSPLLQPFPLQLGGVEPQHDAVARGAERQPVAPLPQGGVLVDEGSQLVIGLLQATGLVLCSGAVGQGGGLVAPLL